MSGLKIYSNNVSSHFSHCTPMARCLWTATSLVAHGLDSDLCLPAALPGEDHSQSHLILSPMYTGFCISKHPTQWHCLLSSKHKCSRVNAEEDSRRFFFPCNLEGGVASSSYVLAVKWGVRGCSLTVTDQWKVWKATPSHQRKSAVPGMTGTTGSWPIAKSLKY